MLNVPIFLTFFFLTLIKKANFAPVKVKKSNLTSRICEKMCNKHGL